MRESQQDFESVDFGTGSTVAEALSERRGPFVRRLAVVVLLPLLAVVAVGGNETLAESAASITPGPERAPSDEYVSSHVLVRLEHPLPATTTDGSFGLLTEFPGLDRVIRDLGVTDIEPALPVSVRRSPRTGALRRYGLNRTYLFIVPDESDILEVVARLSRAPGVEYAEPDIISSIYGTVLPNDPLFPGQWYFQQPSDADIDGPEAWAISSGQDTIVAVVDTGVDSDHEEFVGDDQLRGHNFVNPGTLPEDDYGHGTQVASLVAANTDNGLGIAGTCWNCRLLPVKVYDAHGDAPISRIADGLVWAVDNGARVINLSAGYASSYTTLLSAVNYAYDAGVVFVAATGNSNVTPLNHPARYAETISVGATNTTDQRARPFSCGLPGSVYGPTLDLVAPGDEMVCAVIGGYGSGCGTSFAAPLVAGLVGILRSIDPSLGLEEARHLVRAGAEDEVGAFWEDTPGFDIYHGWGRLNMQRTLGAAVTSSTLHVAGKQTTRVYYSSAIPLAESYDFVRGNLGALSESTLGVDLGPVVCLENDSLDPDTTGNEDLATPAPGEGYFYLGRFEAAPGAGSYGGSSRNRDRRVLRERSGLAWTAEIDQPSAFFGHSVASAGDVNNDGYDDVIVGAESYSNDQVDEGGAFVYLGSATGLASTPVWSAEGDQTGSGFGFSVASAGDVNGDGYDDVLVGAPFHDAPSSDAGRAYIYWGSESGVEATPRWAIDGDQQEAWLGWRVRPAGDVNNDGYDDVVLVAPLYDGGQTDEGRAFVYEGSDLGPSAIPSWVFEPDQAEAFLTGADSAGDVNNDGYGDVIVGAYAYENGQSHEGRSWVFLGSGSGLADTPNAILEMDAPGAYFGVTTATAGDVNGDSYDDVIVGAFNYTNGPEIREGASYVFLGSESGVSGTAHWHVESDQVDGQLGVGVSRAGDVNNDGFGDVIVGTPWYDATRTNEGRAWVYLGSSEGLATAPVWWDTGVQPEARYGWRSASAGDVNGDGFDDVIVGAWMFDHGETNEGRAFVFHGPLVPPTTSDCP